MSRILMLAAFLTFGGGAALTFGGGAAAWAQTDARPARGPEQASVPNAAPPATTGQVTASDDQSGKVKQMNEAEKDKVGQGGK